MRHKEKRWHKATLEHKTTGNRGDTEKAKVRQERKKKTRNLKENMNAYDTAATNGARQSNYSTPIFNGNFCKANEIIFKNWEAQKLLRQAQPLALPEKGGKKIKRKWNDTTSFSEVKYLKLFWKLRNWITTASSSSSLQQNVMISYLASEGGKPLQCTFIL